MADTTTTTQQSGLSDWAAPYVGDYLGKAQALGDADYQVYQGPLTADVSPLQLQSMAGISALQTSPTQYGMATDAAGNAISGMQGMGQYDPAQFSTGTFDAATAQRYMNPYLQASLNPQLQEAQRQADIQRMQQSSQMTQAGAYGGSRQAIMQAQGANDLQRNMANITGTGYANAYDKGAAQFNTEQGRSLDAQRAGEQSRQFGAGQTLNQYQQQLQGANVLGNLGTQQGNMDLAANKQLMDAGNIERGIESEGINADHNEYLRQADYDYNQVNFMRDALTGLPISSVSNSTPDPSFLTQIAGILALSQGMAKGGVVKRAKGGSLPANWNFGVNRSRSVPGGLAGLAIHRMG